MSTETETVQATMCSLKSLDKEISFIKQFPEELPSDISGNEAEMNDHSQMKKSDHDLEKQSYSNIEVNQSNLYNYCNNYYYQQCNHSSPNFYRPGNQINTNIQSIEELTSLTSQFVKINQPDCLLNNHNYSNQQKSLDSYNTSSQFEQPAYFLDNYDPKQWHPDDNIHNYNVLSSRSSLPNMNLVRNGLFNNNLVLTLPKPITTFSSYYPFDGEDEKNQLRPLYSKPMFRTSDSQQLRSQLQPTIQQGENRTISTDINYLSSNQKSDSISGPRDKSSSPLGISNEPFSRLPLFLEPHFQQPTYCNNMMSYSWNIIGSHYNTLSSPIQPSSNENTQPNISLHHWRDQAIVLPDPSQSITSSHSAAGLEQAPTRKRTLQDDMLSEISFNGHNNLYHFTSRKAFAKHQGINPLPNTNTIIGSNISKHEQQNSFQPKNDIHDVVSESPEPPADLNDPRPDARPRRQKLRYPDDMYTPQWVRYSGHVKEGYCDDCKPGKWLQLKNSAYWYHKQFFHGISSVSGKMFAPPVEMRKSDAGNSTEGLCHQCDQWVPITATKKKNSTLWFRHAHKCHVYIKPSNKKHKKN